MKYTVFFSLLFCFLAQPLVAQRAEKLQLSSSAGLGVIGGHYGYAIDGEISYLLFENLQVGAYCNLMSTKQEENPFADQVYLEFSVEGFQRIDNTFSQSTHRSISSFGIQATHNLMDTKKFEFSLGAGLNFNIYNSSDFTINTLSEFNRRIIFIKILDRGYSYHAVGDIRYKFSNHLSISLKARYIRFVQHNLNIMLSAAMRI